jgi:hypothetical protein
MTAAGDGGGGSGGGNGGGGGGTATEAARRRQRRQRQQQCRQRWGHGNGGGTAAEAEAGVSLIFASRGVVVVPYGPLFYELLARLSIQLRKCPSMKELGQTPKYLLGEKITARPSS